MGWDLTPRVAAWRVPLVRGPWVAPHETGHLGSFGGLGGYTSAAVCEHARVSPASEPIFDVTGGHRRGGEGVRCPWRCGGWVRCRDVGFGPYPWCPGPRGVVGRCIAWVRSVLRFRRDVVRMCSVADAQVVGWAQSSARVAALRVKKEEKAHDLKKGGVLGFSPICHSSS